MPRFEIHATDVARARAFYSGPFGWSVSPLEDFEAVDYQLINSDEVGPEKAMTGGILRRTIGSHPPGSAIRGSIMTFEVADCDESYAWALGHGGSEALPPIDYPGIGRAAYVEDGEGNVVGMISVAEGAP
ncbi:MAG: VOC family protein [Pseudomonadota bacterium]